ncbi:MAG: Obg family GTPase CgtA [Candidatus Levybacteria bacterium]|nr:Obg family GTPase CgtA [Candidatus Levybacteria bacterium]MSU25943.1 Obg family GTPase CgtA [Candidatus Levybacteria bacterium]
MLVDDVNISVKAGNGGNGAISFLRNAITSKGGPDGGNGGNGADVYFIGINDITGLQQFQYKKDIKGDHGVAGGKKNLYGKNAKTLMVKVPIGTLITDLSTNTTYDIQNEGQKILIVKGGKGGRGNNEFKSATVQAPKFAEKGENGEFKKIRLTLKLIADVGLVGLPNAGKSSLLQSVTRASPKIGNYPFTTLEPNLGSMGGIILADIPGLIEGASHGKGLGIQFLKHIEKTQLLLHCIDISENNIIASYEIVNKEFSQYNQLLLQKEEIIVLTKSDLIEDSQVEILKKQIEIKLNKKVIVTSIKNPLSISLLIKTVKEKVESIKD